LLDTPKALALMRMAERANGKSLPAGLRKIGWKAFK